MLSWALNQLRLPNGITSLQRVTIWIVLALLIGLATVLFQQAVVAWSLASLSFGGLLGFLFGVPRVEQHDPHDKQDALEAGGGYRQLVNTNLTEISDWLTKIIVGVTLVQLRQIPTLLNSLVLYLAGNDYQPGFVGGTLVFFGVTGFLSGYLLTRLFLAPAFNEADRAAIQFDLQSEYLSAVTYSLLTGEEVSRIIESPRVEVLILWQRLLEASKDALIRRDPKAHISNLASSVARNMLEMGIIDEGQAVTFKRLQRMRNLATHSSENISIDAVLEYIASAKALIEHISKA